MTTDNTNTRNDSLAARTDTWLQSLLVWSPGQRDIIKTVALVLMVLDHANRILHLDQTWMFLAGRGAFPLFALVWGLNLSRHAHIQQVAINRLWGWAVIAQFAYYLADFPWYEGNILFAFAVAAQVLTWCETRSGWRTAAAILLMALWGPLSGTSYGIAGLLMLAVSHRLYRAEDRAERLALVACLLAVIPALNLATSDAAAVPTLDDAVNTLKPWWPGLFDGDTPRLLACGIRDVLLEDVAQRNIPLSHKKLRRALKAITRSESYLCAMKAGACRYDTEGYVTEHISQEEEAYAAERLDKIRRQNRIKAELQAVLDEK
ncbi:conjugal transfer pilus acetylation protein TraX [Escherichia coli]|uniref:conjugal transfer pilus acetylase TraX n=5 Tax=Enterobacteriaceae TaxID=543 RepID=UPI000DA538DD|nr:conjugal transfer pilus acetylation protein TraX [Escherichia coli]